MNQILNIRNTFFSLLFIPAISIGQGFAPSATDWNIPGMGDMDDRFYHMYSRHSVIDMDGDGKPDMVDCDDNANPGVVWQSGAQKYWKVYLNNGSGFSASAINWNIPGMGDMDERINHMYSRHYVMDMDGDGKPDMVDCDDNANPGVVWQNGAQKYWKVYLNTGSGFSASATNWNIPGMGDMDERFTHLYSRHYVMDMNGDDKPDMIDCDDNANPGLAWQNGAQKYWKVYLNTGTGFSASATNWNIPGMGDMDDRFYHLYSRHSVTDMDGDGQPDMVDCDDNANPGLAWQNGAQKYWKVYLNNGSGFSASAINWNIPGMGDMDDRFYHMYSRHSVADMDGDGKPDMVDCDDNANPGLAWQNGAQKYWKVYFNNGSGFSASGTNWNIPGMGDMDDRFYHMYSRHSIADMNGDGSPDLVDSDDNSNPGLAWQNGAQKYWKVYLNTIVPAGILSQNISEENYLVYPNPFTNKVTIAVKGTQSVKVFNVLGSVVFESTIENEKTEIDLSKEPNGIYFVKVGSVLRKMIKE